MADIEWGVAVASCGNSCLYTCEIRYKIKQLSTVRITAGEDGEFKFRVVKLSLTYILPYMFKIHTTQLKFQIKLAVH